MAETNGIQDFKTYADTTDHLTACAGWYDRAMRMPDSSQKQAFVAWLINHIMTSTDAPTRIMMSKDAAEQEKVRIQMAATLEQMKAILAKLEARKEVETFEREAAQNGIDIPTDSEA